MASRWKSYYRRKWRRYYRKKYSSQSKRSYGQMRAAKQQADTASFVMNIPTQISCKSIQANMDNKVYEFGTFALNIFDLLRKSEFYQSYANMYDEFKIDNIKVKLIPTKYNVTVGDTNNSGYQSFTVYTAWDRTGLNAKQLLLKTNSGIYDNKQISPNTTGQNMEYVGKPGDMDGVYCIVGSDITTYSSAESRQISVGQNSSITRWLKPKTMAEKSQWISTTSLKPWYGNYDNVNCSFKMIPIFDNDAVGRLALMQDLGNKALISTLSSISPCISNNPCFIEEDPTIIFKPTLLVGLYPSDTLGTENPRTVHFNIEAEVSTTFRGLRRSRVVTVDNNTNPNPQPQPIIQTNLLKINWNNEDIEAAHTKQDQSINFPDPNYWTGDKLNRVEATNINLGYWTAIQNNFDNVKGEELIQNNEATAILYDAVIAQAKADSNGIIELPSDDYSGMTNFNRRGKNYETSIKIDVSSLTGNFEIPNLNPQTTNITENGTYEIADSDNNPQDMEIERVDNRVLNLNKVKDGESLRDGSISLGRFNVNVPILPRYSNLIKSTSSSYDDPTPEARDYVLIQNRTTPPENYKGVYETSNSTALISKTIKSNGTYLIKDDDYYNDLGQNQGVIGWWKVNVSVPPQQVNPTIKRLRYDGDYYDIVPSEFIRIQGKQTVSDITAGDLFIIFTYDQDTAFWNPYVYHFASSPMGGGYPIGIEGNTITYYKKVHTNKSGATWKPTLEYITYYDENRDDIISYDLDSYFADDDFSNLWTNLPAYGELPKSNIGDCIIVPFSRT